MTEPAQPAAPGRRKRAGLIGTVIGVAAAGVAAGVAVERLVVRRSRNRDDDPCADEPFGRLPYDETMTVTTEDGISIHVEIIEPQTQAATSTAAPEETGTGEPGTGEPGAGGRGSEASSEGGVPPTLVFVHGFCLDQGTFHFQRKALDEVGRHRMIFYDQPGHGFSSSLAEGEYELPTLGDALYDVIKATTAPTEQILLIGHSMGGMVVMAAAERHPELFTDRVCGVVLIATSGGQVNGSRLFGLPEIISRTAPGVMTVVNGASRLTGGMVDKLRRASTDLAWLLTRRYGFGGEKPSPALVSYVEQMNSRTSTDTVARYLRTLYSHARYPALRTLEDLPVLLITGEKDMITPLAHSEEIARLLPRAEYVKIPNSGHVVMLECADEVNAALLRFLEQW